MSCTWITFCNTRLVISIEMINWFAVFNVTSQAWHKVWQICVKQFQMQKFIVLFFLIIYKKQFLHSDCLRTCQLIPNQWRVQFYQCKKVKLSAERWNWVQNSEMKSDWQLLQNWAGTNKMVDKIRWSLRLYLNFKTKT